MEPVAVGKIHLGSRTDKGSTKDHGRDLLPVDKVVSLLAELSRSGCWDLIGIAVVHPVPVVIIALDEGLVVPGIGSIRSVMDTDADEIVHVSVGGGASAKLGKVVLVGEIDGVRQAHLSRVVVWVIEESGNRNKDVSRQMNNFMTKSIVDVGLIGEGGVDEIVQSKRDIGPGKGVGREEVSVEANFIQGHDAREVITDIGDSFPNVSGE